MEPDGTPSPTAKGTPPDRAAAMERLPWRPASAARSSRLNSVAMAHDMPLPPHPAAPAIRRRSTASLPIALNKKPRRILRRSPDALRRSYRGVCSPCRATAMPGLRPAGPQPCRALKSGNAVFASQKKHPAFRLMAGLDVPHTKSPSRPCGKNRLRPLHGSAPDRLQGSRAFQACRLRADPPAARGLYARVFPSRHRVALAGRARTRRIHATQVNGAHFRLGKRYEPSFPATPMPPGNAVKVKPGPIGSKSTSAFRYKPANPWLRQGR
jgi:hypothetical protein